MAAASQTSRQMEHVTVRLRTGLEVAAVVRVLVVAARAGLLDDGLGNSGVVSIVDAAVELRKIGRIVAGMTSARVGGRYDTSLAFRTIGGAGDVFWRGGGFI